ncbi:MAG TPA: phage holin family protein [Candidatus Cybelea sp.]|jgi:hypothetical protein|nr:phage holin family protein [Candidatus Cybelea sp.]
MLSETPPRPYELRAQPTKSLLQRLYRDVSLLASEELEVAKVEVRDRGTAGLQALRGLTLSMACAVVAMASFAACAIAALVFVVALWLAALIVGVAFIVAAIVLATLARQQAARAAQPMVSAIGKIAGRSDAGETIEQRQSRIELARREIAATLAALENKSDLVGPLRDTAFGLGSLGIAVAAIVRNNDR